MRFIEKEKDKGERERDREKKIIIGNIMRHRVNVPL